MNWHRIGRTTEHPQGLARYLIRGNHLYVFCDGTATLQQWRWNFMTLTRGLQGGARASRADWQQAHDAYIELSYAVDIGRFHDITISGYSRGGGIAILLAWMIGAPASAFVFAGKRVGNRKLMRGVTHSNYWHRGDPVPWLPFRYAAYSNRLVFRPWMWPWKAHMETAHTAAYWRYEVANT